jgi:hypothetical protein
VNIHIDVSADALNPSSVLEFIREHSRNRPGQNILFKVSRSVFDQFMADIPKAVAVSTKEAARISDFLGVPASSDGFTVTHETYCSNCKRRLNFYDLFETGRKRHGDDFMRHFLAGGEFHIQLAAENEAIEVQCTNCGEVNSLLPNGGSYLHYSGSVGGSAYTYA